MVDNMVLILKALFGALIMTVITLLTGTRNYYIAGLVPLFPTFTLIAHYTVGAARTPEELKGTILFSIWALIPYVAYLFSSYYFIDKVGLKTTLVLSTMLWCLMAGALLAVWNHVK